MQSRITLDDVADDALIDQVSSPGSRAGLNFSAVPGLGRLPLGGGPNPRPASYATSQPCPVCAAGL